MNGLVSGAALVKADRAEVLQAALELCMEVLPFAHAQVRKKIAAAKLSPLVLGTEGFPAFMDRVPNVEQRQENGLGSGEPLMRRSRRVFLIQRALAGILDAQPGGDDQQLARGVFVLSLTQHPTERGIDGQTRQVLPRRGQLALIIESAQFVQQ